MVNRQNFNYYLTKGTYATPIEQKLKNGLIDEILFNFPEVTRVQPLSSAEFKTKFRDTNTPVIIENSIQDWPAIKKWSFNYLREKCGSSKVVTNHYISSLRQETTFADFVDYIENPLNANTPRYLQEWHIYNDHPELLQDFGHLEVREYDVRPKLYGQSNMHLWIGQRGSVTQMHADTQCIDVLHAQIVGRKQWILFGPDVELNQHDDGAIDIEGFVRNRSSVILHGVLKPGDVIFLPMGWYHRICLLDNCISLGMQSLDEKNLVGHVRERFSELIALALNGENLKKTEPTMYAVYINRTRQLCKALNVNLDRLPR